MKMKRTIASAMACAAMVGMALAPAANATAGSTTVPITDDSSGGCYRYITIWWDTSKPTPAGTSGRVTC